MLIGYPNDYCRQTKQKQAKKKKRKKAKLHPYAKKDTIWNNK